MKNPFPKPPLTSKHIQTIEWIQQRINSPQGLNFHDCLQKTEEAIDKNDKEQALINCYYTVNIIINSNQPENQKLSLITGLTQAVSHLATPEQK